MNPEGLTETPQTTAICSSVGYVLTAVAMFAQFLLYSELSASGLLTFNHAQSTFLLPPFPNATTGPRK